MVRKIISADSHVTETPDTYRPRMPAKLRDQAPYVTHDAERGDLFIIPGMKASAVPVGLIFTTKASRTPANPGCTWGPAPVPVRSLEVVDPPTYALPVESTARADTRRWTGLSLVAGPLMTAIGAVSPLLPAAYTFIELLHKFAT